MTDRNALHDPNEPPEDVASLYSWANLHGAKYRDFSASRAQNREKTRLSMQQAEEQQLRARRDAELLEAEAARRAAEEALAAERARQAEFEAYHAAQQAAIEAAHQAAQQAARQAAQLAAQQAAQEMARQAAEQAARDARAAQLAAEQAAQQAAQERARQAAEQAAREAHAAQLAARQAAEVAAQQAAEEQARQAAELAAQQAAEERARQAAERVAQERARQAAEQAAQEARAAQAEAAQRAAQQAALQAAQEMARRAAEQAAQEARAAQAHAAQHAEAARAAQQAAQQAAWQQPLPERFAPPAQAPAPSLPSGFGSPPPPVHPPYPAAASSSQPQRATVREDIVPPPARTPWSGPEGREIPTRPAWLADRPTLSGIPIVTQPQTPDDTIQGSRERLTSRWFALKGVFDASAVPATDPASAPLTARPPVLAVFSLAGGVGKTSLVATLGRALSSRGERVLLVDTAAFGLLPFFFGARDQRPGQLRTFSPPAISGDAPIQMIAMDPEALEPEHGGQEPLTTEIQQYSRGVGRVIVDVATASGSTTRRILRLSPLVLVPLFPDMNSVVSVSSIDAFFERNSSIAGKSVLPHYVLNQFDASLPLHLDVREVLREQLGDRLLPFALRRAPAVSEALAEGMTVMDYAPNSTIAEDFGSLAGWVKSQSAPASTGLRGVRWSER